MPQVSDRAICLRRLDFSETSQILWLLTREHGLVKAIAKGARRTTQAGKSKFDGGLDLLSLGQAVLIHAPEKELSQLTEWSLLDGQLPLRRSLRGIMLGQWLAEMVMLLFEQQDAHPAVFDDMETALALLGEAGLEEAAVACENRVLAGAGVTPEWTLCGRCRGNVADGTARCYFSPSLASVLCQACEGACPDRLGFEPRLARFCRTLAGSVAVPLARLRLPRLARAQTEPIRRVILEHVRHLSGRSPHLTRYLLDGGGGGG